MKNLDSYGQFIKIKLKQNLEVKTISLSQRIYIQKTLKYANILDSKSIYFFFILKINISKSINKLLNKDFQHFYKSYDSTHI